MWKRFCKARKKLATAAIDQLESRYLLAGIPFDSDFAGGFVSLLPSATPRAADVAILQADGKIVVAGHTTADENNWAVSVSRYNTDGSMDKSFNAGKPDIIDISPAIDQPVAMVQETDGKIVLLALENEQPTTGLVLIRLNTDGSLDQSFGNDGITAAAPLGVNGAEMLALPGNKIDLAGYLGTSEIVGVVQYNSAGAIDSSFGKNGTATILGSELLASAVSGGEPLILSAKNISTRKHLSEQQFILTKLAADGTVDPGFGVVLGDAVKIYPDTDVPAVFDGSRFLLPEYNPVAAIIAIRTNGRVDEKFGTDGTLWTSDVQQLAAAPDGRIFAASSVYQADNDPNGNVVQVPGLVRVFTVHGRHDNSFSGNGSTGYTLPDTDFPLTRVLAQADGKIVLVGTSDDPSGFALIRFTASGELDKTFGSGGVVRSVTPGVNGENSVIVAQPDGKFIVGGYTQVPGQAQTLLLQRYNADDTLDPSFIVDDFVRKHFTIGRLFLLGDGSLLASGSSMVFRLTSTGKLDTRLAGKGYVSVASSIVTSAKDGSFFVANGQSIQRFSANGSLDKSFGNNGTATLSAAPGSTGFDAIDIDLQPDGSIIVTGQGQASEDPGEFEMSVELLHFSSQGKRDQSFGDGGGITEVPDSDGGFAGQTAIGPDGSIYNISGDVDGYPVLFDFDAKGKPLGNNGTFLFNHSAYVNDFTVESDGQLVLAGGTDAYDSNGIDRDVIVVGRGPDDPKFYFGGTRDIDLGDYSYSTAVAVAANGDLLIAGYALSSPAYDPPLTLPRRVILRVRGNAVPGTIEQQGDVVYINGTSRADTVVASTSGSHLRLALNGQTYVFDAQSIKQIDAYMGGGDDQVDLGSITIPALLHGEAGNDTLTGGAGDDTLVGDAGADVLAGGKGTDTADYSSRTVNLNLSINGKADDGAPGEHDNIETDIEQVIGGEGNDSIVGSNGNDILQGGPEGSETLAQDTLVGLGGDDLLHGYHLFPGTGNDTLDVNFNDDNDDSPVPIVDYSDRSDPMVANLAAGTVTFASGEVDHLPFGVITFIGGAGNDQIIAGSTTSVNYGDPTQFVYGGAGDDTISAGNGLDVATEFFGGGGNDQLIGGDTLVGGPGADMFTGRSNGDTYISYDYRSSAVLVDLFNGKIAPDEGDKIVGLIHGIIGTKYNDTIIGTSGRDTLIGGSGNDSIDAAAGVDYLEGDDGNDTLLGGNGGDQLIGGLGSDLLSGGAGIDIADYSGRTENLQLSLDGIANDGAAGEHDNILSDVEQIQGGSGNDRIIGNSVDNFLEGNAGDDTIYGGDGNDTLYADEGHNLLFGQGGDDLINTWTDPARDTVDGGSGNNTAQPTYDSKHHVLDQLTNIQILDQPG